MNTDRDLKDAPMEPNNPPHKVRYPIRAKITFPYLVLTLVIAVAAAFLITQLVVENIEERFTNQLYEAGKISSELVVGYEADLLEMIRLLSNIEGVDSALNSADADSLRSLVMGVIVNNQVEAVEFLNRAGDHILSIHHLPGGNIEDYSYSTGKRTMYSDLEIVQKVLEGQSDEKGDKFADLVLAEQGLYLYIAGPVVDQNGNLTGTVLVGIAIPRMLEDIRTNTFAQITIYDRAGEVIASTLPFPQALSPEIPSQVISSKDTSSTRRDLSNQREFQASNLNFTEILGVFEVRGNFELGVLGVALSKNYLIQTSTASRWQIFLLVAAANFLIIFFGFNLANQITRPLIKLMKASVKVSQGDLNVEVKTQTNDEISVLTEAFNTMVASLNKSQQDLIKTYDDTLEGWAVALEMRDKETEGHSKRVTEMTVQLAQALGIAEDALVNIRRGALLHDIGKMGTPDAILHKEGALTVEERGIINRHPQDAYNMLHRIDYLRTALEIPYCHHEKWDGTGYPRGLKGEDIPISARIFALVDVWDALTNDRPYRKALPLSEAIQYIQSQRGSHFDPRIVDIFMRFVSDLK